MLIDIASCINIIKDKKLRSKSIRVDKIFLLRSFLVFIIEYFVDINCKMYKVSRK